MKSVKKQQVVPADRSRCGHLGKGKPGRGVRRLAFLRTGAFALGSVKAWARTDTVGRAWLDRKRDAA